MTAPTFILVRPQMGENIGAAARAMLNFGLDRMRIVDPRDGWPNSKAVAMASGAGKKVAVLFGPERAGLENSDVVLANAIISVPVNPEFPSLNLSQCALLLGYEWRRQTEIIAPEVMEFARTELASRIEIEKLGDHYEEKLDAAGFFYPEPRVEGMKLSLRNMWGRLNLTRAEVQTFHGVLRQVAWKLKQDGE